MTTMVKHVHFNIPAEHQASVSPGPLAGDRGDDADIKGPLNRVSSLVCDTLSDIVYHVYVKHFFVGK